MLVSLTEEKTYKMLVEKMDAGESFIGEDILLEFTNYELRLPIHEMGFAP